MTNNGSSLLDTKEKTFAEYLSDTQFEVHCCIYDRRKPDLHINLLFFLFKVVFGAMQKNLLDEDGKWIDEQDSINA